MPRPTLLALFVALVAWIGSGAEARADTTRSSGSCPPLGGLWTGGIEGSIAPHGGAGDVVVVAHGVSIRGCSFHVVVHGDRYALQGLPDGVWHLVGYARGRDGALRAGGYTDSVTCLARCGIRGICCGNAHHALLDITVSHGATLRHVSIADWTATTGHEARWHPPDLPAEVPRP